MAVSSASVWECWQACGEENIMHKIDVFETWQNGNIADAKKAVKRMTKAKFIDFIEFARANGVMPYELRILVKG